MSVPVDPYLRATYTCGCSAMIPRDARPSAIPEFDPRLGGSFALCPSRVHHGSIRATRLEWVDPALDARYMDPSKPRFVAIGFRAPDHQTTLEVVNQIEDMLQEDYAIEVEIYRASPLDDDD